MSINSINACVNHAASRCIFARSSELSRDVRVASATVFSSSLVNAQQLQNDIGSVVFLKILTNWWNFMIRFLLGRLLLSWDLLSNLDNNEMACMYNLSQYYLNHLHLLCLWLCFRINSLWTTFVALFTGWWMLRVRIWKISRNSTWIGDGLKWCLHQYGVFMTHDLG